MFSLFRRIWPNELEQTIEQYISALDSPTVKHQAQESLGLFVSTTRASKPIELTYEDIQRYSASVHAICHGYSAAMNMRALRMFLRYTSRQGKIRIDPECIHIEDGYGAVSVKEILKPYMQKIRFSDGRRSDKKKIRDFYYYHFVKKLSYTETAKEMKTTPRQLTRYRQYLEIAGKDKLISGM